MPTYSMEQPTTTTAACCRLLVRKLPKWLRSEDKESLLRHFGAKEVAVMSSRGKLKHCVFASFSSHEDTKLALNKLHQLDVFGCRLVVEYASPWTAQHESVEDRWQCDKTRRKEPDDDSDEQSHPLTAGDTSAVDEMGPPFTPAPPLLAIAMAPPSATASHLLYSYPPPNQTILTNIAHTLACVPELYVQVLHLMNKMNLPPPFGPLTPTPPLSQPEAVRTNVGEPVKEKKKEEEEEEEEESEMESEEEQRLTSEIVGVGKRKIKSVKRRKVSFHQVKDLPAAKVFKEEPVQKQTIIIKPPTDLPSTDQLTPAAEPQTPDTIFTIGAASTLTSVVQGTPDTTTPDVPSLTSQELIGEHNSLAEYTGNHQNSVGETFITTDEILAHRITAEEMRDHHLYKNYSRGEPSMRLYIKNLGKQVVDQDLRFIFGRYVNWTQEVEQDRFDIRLMQLGRMKGQAFVGLPSERAAVKAVEEMNGYMLHGRPMMVQFARSIKSKDQAPSNNSQS